jgi:2-polyprenyl-3-methyl-5-hydroxy-6-metoxy-1,4-benzoquinol methylase
MNWIGRAHIGWYDENEFEDAARIDEVLRECALPILSSISRRLKHLYFLDKVSVNDRVLEIGCGDGWVGRYLRGRGVRQVDAIDTTPEATVVGDIREWKCLGLDAQSFDVIIAFEVLEHVDCMNDCFALLKPGGRLMITSPYPPMDWFLERLEKWKLNQPRTSPHNNLTYFKETPQFRIARMWRPLWMSQWCILARKSAANGR